MTLGKGFKMDQIFHAKMRVLKALKNNHKFSKKLLYSLL